jgi:hypothetical protein
MIPKPKTSEMSEGADRLRRAMGLIDDKTTYLAIQVSAVLKRLTYLLIREQSTIRDLVHRANLDMQLEYRRQSMKDLGDLFKMVRSR